MQFGRRQCHREGCSLQLRTPSAQISGRGWDLAVVFVAVVFILFLILDLAVIFISLGLTSLYIILWSNVLVHYTLV